MSRRVVWLCAIGLAAVVAAVLFLKPSLEQMKRENRVREQLRLKEKATSLADSKAHMVDCMEALGTPDRIDRVDDWVIWRYRLEKSQPDQPDDLLSLEFRKGSRSLERVYVLYRDSFSGSASASPFPHHPDYVDATGVHPPPTPTD